MPADKANACRFSAGISVLLNPGVQFFYLRFAPLIIN